MDLEIFKSSRDVFLDVVNAEDYIELDRISHIYQSLKESISKPLKMVLLYGKPGTGKSMFLTKLYYDLINSTPVYMYNTPIIDESEFFKTLAQDMFNVKYDAELNFTQFMKILNNNVIEKTPVILLDEAQLYPNSLMEKIRLLSDTRSVKFVIALHKTEKEDLIAKEHFQTRIWENIELKNASSEELQIYIQKKLMRVNCFDTANMFNKKSMKKIYKLTNGNYRDTNKLVFTLFEIYIAYIQSGKKNKIHTKYVTSKIVEMAALHTGLIRG
jgi:type II secretory pathway predicted ATPase ExeA